MEKELVFTEKFIAKTKNASIRTFALTYQCLCGWNPLKNPILELTDDHFFVLNHPMG